MIVKLIWTFQNQRFSKIVELIQEDDEDFHFDHEIISSEVLEEFKKEGYLIFRNLEDGSFEFVHVNLVRSLKVL